MTAQEGPRLKQGLDDLAVGDSSWLHLGQLRALVARADELGWPDSSLVSHSNGREHPYRRDIRIATRITVEGKAP